VPEAFLACKRDAQSGQYCKIEDLRSTLIGLEQLPVLLDALVWIYLSLLGC
jgi:hypothetical protein